MQYTGSMSGRTITDPALQTTSCCECGYVRRTGNPPYHALDCSSYLASEKQAASTKPTNPKDAIATDKTPLHLVPASFKAYTALALAEGAMKYGAHNWRASGVRASIYIAALQRHLATWWNGESQDPKTGVPHLANACACLAIIIDASESDMITDDRPPAQKMLPDLVDDRLPASIAKLREVFGHMEPHHWTISDDLPDA